MRTAGLYTGFHSLTLLLAAIPFAHAQEAAPVEAPLPDDAPAPDPEALYPELLENTLSVEGDIADTDAPRASWLRRDSSLDSWFAWKQRLQQRSGFTFGGSWGLLYQHYSSALRGDRDAIGSKFTLNLSQDILNRGKPNALSFDMAIEDRRPLFTDQPPLQAGILAGSGIPTAATWGRFDLGVTQAYIRQNFGNNRFQYTVGKIFAPNFVNAYPFFDDNRQFLSLAFSTSPTIAVPLRGFGFVAAAYPTKGNLYLKGGMFTARSSDTGWTVDDFFNVNEHFYFFEAGWTRVGGTGVPIHARGPMDRDNFHITSWYRDPLANGSPRAYGFAFNANFMAGQDYMWFVRGGWSDGALADLALSGGIGYRPPAHPADLFGAAIGWARPSNRVLDSQYVGEVFYRFHVTPHLAFTPNIQLILNPTLDPTHDSMAVFSFRTRISF
jgi:porin